MQVHFGHAGFKVRSVLVCIPPLPLNWLCDIGPVSQPLCKVGVAMPISRDLRETKAKCNYVHKRLGMELFAMIINLSHVTHSQAPPCT